MESATWQLFERQYQQMMRASTPCPQHSFMSNALAQSMQSLVGIVTPDFRYATQHATHASELQPQPYGCGQTEMTNLRVPAKDSGRFRKFSTSALPAQTMKQGRLQRGLSWIDTSIVETLHNVASKGTLADCAHVFRLSGKQRLLIRCILQMKFLAARDAFQKSRKPSDLRIAMEQNSSGYTQISIRLKEIMRKLDQLIGKPSFLLRQSFHSGQLYPSETSSTPITPTKQAAPKCLISDDNLRVSPRMPRIVITTNQERVTVHPERTTLNPEKTTINSERENLNLEMTTLHPERATLNPEKSKVWRSKSSADDFPTDAEEAGTSEKGGACVLRKRTLSMRKAVRPEKTDRHALTLFSRVAALENQMQSLNHKVDRVLDILELWKPPNDSEHVHSD